MPIDALLLDAGGTLLAEHPPREELYAAAGRRRGLEVDGPRMRACMGLAHRSLPRIVRGAPRYSFPWFEEFIADVFARQLGLAPAELPGLRDELFAVFADPRSFRLLPGARELLEGARAADLRLALVSNWSPAMPDVLAGLGVSGLFDALLVSAVEGVEKPDPEIFLRALARLNVPAARALHVGNEPVQDVAGAAACGVRCLLFDPDDRHAALPHPRVRALAEVLPWIRQQP